MKKGVAHWHIFAVFALVSIGCLVLAMKAESVGKSLEPMLQPVDRGLAAHFERQEELKEEWMSNNVIVGETPSFSKAVSVAVILFGALGLLLLAVYSKRKRRIKNSKL